MLSLLLIFFFFFQAEDGIRDFHVTGVQTCALPISDDLFFTVDGKLEDAAYHIGALRVKMCMCIANCTLFKCHFHHHHFFVISQRSEERRVGKECRSWWWPCHYKERKEYETEL